MTNQEQCAYSNGARSAINGYPNVIATQHLVKMTQAEVFAWREGYATYKGKFVIKQHGVKHR